MAVVTMRQLLESGVHFGHQTRRWNPKMKRFILTERSGIYILDLQQTVADIDVAYEFVKETVAHGGTMLFVGTKKQAQESIKEQATRVGMPYVSERWLGGMLTNFSTVHKRLQRLKELEQYDFEDTDSTGLTKKELLMMSREKDKLSRTLGGIRDMVKVPSAVWVVDTKKEHLAIAEAKKLGIPVIAILDTNCDPDEVDYGIPGNDDAIRAVDLLTKVIADACADGLMQRSKKQLGGEAENAEPLAEWERELLESDSAAAAAEEPKSEEKPAEAPETAPAKTESEPAPKAAAAEKPAAKAEEKEAEKTAAKKPAAKKPAAKKPAAKKPAAKAAEKPAAKAEEKEAEKEAEKPAAKTAAKKPAAKKPAAKKPAAKAAEKPAAKAEEKETAKKPAAKKDDAKKDDAKDAADKAE